MFRFVYHRVYSEIFVLFYEISLFWNSWYTCVSISPKALRAPDCIAICVIPACVIGNMTKIMTRDLISNKVITDEITLKSVHSFVPSCIGITLSNKMRYRLDSNDMAAIFRNKSYLNRGNFGNQIGMNCPLSVICFAGKIESAYCQFASMRQQYSSHWKKNKHKFELSSWLLFIWSMCLHPLPRPFLFSLCSWLACAFILRFRVASLSRFSLGTVRYNLCVPSFILLLSVLFMRLRLSGVHFSSLPTRWWFLSHALLIFLTSLCRHCILRRLYLSIALFLSYAHMICQKSFDPSYHILSYFCRHILVRALIVFHLQIEVDPSLYNCLVWLCEPIRINTVHCENISSHILSSIQWDVNILHDRLWRSSE